MLKVILHKKFTIVINKNIAIQQKYKTFDQI